MSRQEEPRNRDHAKEEARKIVAEITVTHLMKLMQERKRRFPSQQHAFAILILTIALLLYILIPSLSWAESGAPPYHGKCSTFRTMRIPMGLGEFARETGSNLRVHAAHRVEVGHPAGNARKP